VLLADNEAGRSQLDEKKGKEKWAAFCDRP
jgi:hypothetical protein